MNRQGTVFDMILVLFILFFAFIISAIALYFMNSFTLAINQTSGSNFDTAKTATQNINNDAPGAIDFIVIMLMVGFPLASMILAFFNDMHPLFFYVSMVVVLLIVLIGYAYGSLSGEFTKTSIGQSAAVSMPMTTFIMNHYGLYALLCCIIILFGSYVKIRSTSYGYG